jgi:regulator of protease activity HflC (stomatin/prohibitin superfamily)
LKFLIAGIVLVIICYNLFFVYVRPDEYGIKVDRVGMNPGVQKEVYHAGLAFMLPFGLQQMFRLPKGIQVLELTNFPETAARAARKDRAAHIQTSDGFFVDLDVSMIYHIKDPYLVFTTIGPGNLFEDNGIIPKAEPALKETLGKLTTEEFYNSPLRVERNRSRPGAGTLFQIQPGDPEEHRGEEASGSDGVYQPVGGPGGQGRGSIEENRSRGEGDLRR